MSCAHCSARVEKALSAVEGVESAHVDLEAKTAAITLAHPVEDSVLEAAVTEAGYEPAGLLSGEAPEPIVRGMKVEGMSCAHCSARYDVHALRRFGGEGSERSGRRNRQGRSGAEVRQCGTDCSGGR